MRFKVFKRGGYKSGGFTLSGGTVNGPLMLSRDPVQALEAANKNYVDVRFNNLDGSNFKSGTIPAAALPSFSGDVVNTAGSSQLVLKETGVSPGTYPKVAVDAKGRVTNGYALTAEDIPNVSWLKINSGKPTTLVGYGITDALKPEGGVLTGVLKSTVTPTAALHIANKAYVDSKTGNSDGVLVAGDIIRKLKSTTPTGFLRANGGEVSKADYPALYSAVGDANSIDLQPGSGKPWKQQYNINTEQSGDITGWTTGTVLPGALADSQAVVTKNRVYLLGGREGSGYTVSTVYTAPINSDGTLGTWTTGTSLPEALRSSQAVVTKNRVYLLGGYNGTYTSTVYTAPINSDGTLGSWTTGPELPVALTQSQAVVTKNRVYLLGGDNGGLFSTVYTTPINSDGTLGTWTTDTALPGALGRSQAVVTKNRVYLLGGLDGSSTVSTVYTAPINSDGTLGSWATGTALPGALGYSQAVVTKNRVYLLGGYNGTYTYVSTVYTAPINTDGTLGTWVTGTALPGSLGNSQAVVTKNRVYLLGGITTGYTYTVYTAPILGGLNDYSLYYDGSLTPTDPTKFRLPDYSSKELSGSYTYIKY